MADPPKKLAIVGASARAATFSALGAGYRVVAADLFADADLARACQATRVNHYPTGLADWLVATDCDAWMYTGALENHADLVDRMAALRPLLGNDGPRLREVRDPLKLQAALAEVGVAFPETRPTADGLPLDGSWLGKTYRGGGGSGVWRLDGVAALERAVRDRAVFQRLEQGVPAAAVFIVDRQQAALAGVTRQLLGPHGDATWQYRGSVGPLEINANCARQLEAVGTLLARRYQLRGLVGVDLLIAEDRVIVIEINPRYTASMEIVEQFTGASLLSAHVAACTGTPIDRVSSSFDLASPGRNSAEDDSHYAKTVLFARRDVTVSSRFAEWALQFAGVDPERRVLADIPPAGDIIAAGRPALTAFAAGASAADCQQRLDERLAEVEARLYDG